MDSPDVSNLTETEQLKLELTRLLALVENLQKRVTSLERERCLPPVDQSRSQIDEALSLKGIEAPKYSPGEGIDPIEFLRLHYGRYLTFFGAEVNSLFQHHLRVLDVKLFNAIRNRLYYLQRSTDSALKFADILPSMPHVSREDLSGVTVEDLEKDPRLAAVVYSRARRQKKE